MTIFQPPKIRGAVLSSPVTGRVARRKMRLLTRLESFDRACGELRTRYSPPLKAYLRLYEQLTFLDRLVVCCAQAQARGCEAERALSKCVPALLH